MCKTENIRVVPYTGAWHAIKYPGISWAPSIFLDRSESYISPTAQIAKSAIIDGKVIIGDNVRVLENAVIRGPLSSVPGQSWHNTLSEPTAISVPIA